MSPCLADCLKGIELLFVLEIKRSLSGGIYLIILLKYYN